MTELDRLIQKELPALSADVEAIAKGLDEHHPELPNQERLLMTVLLLIARLRVEMRRR